MKSSRSLIAAAWTFGLAVGVAGGYLISRFINERREDSLLHKVIAFKKKSEAAVGAVISAAVRSGGRDGQKTELSTETPIDSSAGADVPDNAPHGCPGVESEAAGKSAACDGCPNQGACSSGQAAKPDPAISKIGKKLADVKHKILVLSGKGGVGKSTIATQIAWLLAEKELGVGLLDVDICGPSIPRMTGTAGSTVRMVRDGWCPVYVNDNFSVMSVGYLLPDEDDAIIWRGPKKTGMIRQFLYDVRWGALDFLIVDTPPGTTDEHLSVVTYLKETQVDGAILVTTPQEISLQDVRKEINFCKRVNIRVLGVIENMAGSIFESANKGGAKIMCEKMEVPYAGSVSLSEQLLKAGEAGIYSTNQDIYKALENCFKQINIDLNSLKKEDSTETNKNYSNMNSTQTLPGQ